MIDYYKILEIDEYAEITIIKKSYRVLAKKYHPDLNPEDDESAEKFQIVNKAYEVLSNPKERQKYDELRKKQGQSTKKTESQAQQEAQAQEKNSDQESVKVRFDNFDAQFENFFGFNPRTNEFDKTKFQKKKEKKTSVEFENFFGFRKK